MLSSLGRSLRQRAVGDAGSGSQSAGKPETGREVFKIELGVSLFEIPRCWRLMWEWRLLREFSNIAH